MTRLRRDLAHVLRISDESPNLDFYLSSVTEHNPFTAIEDVVHWLESLNSEQYFDVERIALDEMRNWRFDAVTDDLCHDSNRFFSIRGLKVRSNIGPVTEWTQPIIHQPEIGVLGILTKKVDGILYLLMQAKAEPGNLNTFQLAPTVQATRSNYTRVHGGKPSKYLEYFLEDGHAETLIDQLQSEQGARFYRKRNRNVIVRVRDDDAIEAGPNFRWLTLGQIRQLARRDDTVNMSARSVLSCISYDTERKLRLDPVREDELLDCLGSSPLAAQPVDRLAVKLMVSAHGNSPALLSREQLLRRISRQKFGVELDTQLIPLQDVQQWHKTRDEISHVDGKFFSVIGVRVSASGREVSAWDQPIVKQVDPGLVGFITREVDGVLHFLVQLKMESGNLDVLQLAPTVQCITGNYEEGARPPYVDEVLAPTTTEILLDTSQSEEGGRFFKEANRNVLLVAGEAFPLDELPRYVWMSKRQLDLFLQLGNFLNVEARSLISIL